MRHFFMIPILALALAVPAAAQADEYSFDVNAKFVNISFISEMDVEDILGTSNAIKGSVDLSKGNFKLEVPVASLKTGIDMRDEHLRSEMWLDAANNPNLVFEGSKIDDLGGGKYKFTGKFTARGKAKDLSVVVNLKKIPAAKATKVGLGEGGAIRVRGEFALKLSDFGIQIPGMAAAKVNDEWLVKISLFGVAK
jgi:polyisoprenoid-binding protein YceI